MKTTALHQNPFAILGATTRDDPARIVELTEEKLLELDHNTCQKARNDLTNPRIRLSVEMAWMPGLSPRKATQLLETLLSDPMSIREESGVATLALLNLMAAAFEAVGPNNSAEDISEFIQEMAYLAEDVSIDEIMCDINEDRAISGFPKVSTADQVEAELSGRKRYYRTAIKDALDRLPSSVLIEVMTEVVDAATCSGDDHAPELIADLVDSYAVETQGFLEKEAENVEKLIKIIRNSAESGEHVVKPIIDKLAIVARNWDKVAQPIQLGAKARGVDHEPSYEMAYSIRSLAIDLYNNHEMLAQSQRLTGLLQELFAEVPEVSEKVQKDADALDEIFRNRKQSEMHKKEWEQEISFRAEVGIIFKDILSISPKGIAWADKCYPLETVTRIRWGGVRHSVNGIPTGIKYTLAFGDNDSEAVVQLKKESTYSAFIGKLWHAVGIRLLTESLEALKSGEYIHIGEATLRDDSVALVKHKFLGSNQLVWCTWAQVRFWCADGAFYLGAKEDNKTYAGLSYIHLPNVHIIEQVIRMAFKKAGMIRLSDILQ